MALNERKTASRLNYIDNAGKLDNSQGASPRQEFNKLVPEYRASKDNYKLAKDDLKEAEIKLQEYENKSISERMRHPIRNRRLHNQLRNNVNQKRIARDKAKIQYKAKQREMRQLKREVSDQYKAVKDFEKFQKIYKELTDPSNAKYVSLFPAQRAQIDADYNSYEAKYNSQQFRATKSGGNIIYDTVIRPSGPSFEAMQKAYHDLKEEKRMQRARQIAKAVEKTAQSIGKRLNPNQGNDMDP